MLFVRAYFRHLATNGPTPLESPTPKELLQSQIDARTSANAELSLRLDDQEAELVALRKASASHSEQMKSAYDQYAHIKAAILPLHMNTKEQREEHWPPANIKVWGKRTWGDIRKAALVAAGLSK